MRPARRARRMHSPAAVALTPRLAAIFRLDMPPADSLSTSRMLRMGNLGPGMPRSRGKGAKPCRFADHPTALITLVHSWSRSPGMGGRDPSERVFAINWNEWSRSIGIAGRDQPVRAGRCAARIASRRALGLVTREHRSVLVGRILAPAPPPIGTKLEAVFNHAPFVDGVEADPVLVKSFGEVDWPIWIVKRWIGGVERLPQANAMHRHAVHLRHCWRT